MVSLGNLDWTEGKYKESQELAMKVLDGNRRTFGEDHRWTIAAMNTLSSRLATAPVSSGLRDPAKAVELSKRAVAAFPQNANYWYTLGNAQHQAGDWEEAIQAMEKSMELGKGGNRGENHPSTIVATNDLSWYLAVAPESSGLRNPARAVALGEKAVAAAPQVAGYWNTLGVAHYRAGEWKEATKALEKSIELDNGAHSIDWFFLAMAHWQLGHRDQARQWYNKAVAAMKKEKSRDPELLRFRAEAEALIIPGAVLPADVFAP
jgi:tetratricopeptide (TPR) repeat protein